MQRDGTVPTLNVTSHETQLYQKKNLRDHKHTSHPQANIYTPKCFFNFKFEYNKQTKTLSTTIQLTLNR